MTITDERPEVDVAALCAHLAGTPRERLLPGAADTLLDVAETPAGAAALLTHLATAMGVASERLDRAVERWQRDRSDAAAAALNAASESPRQAVLRALTTADDGPYRLVRLRSRLLQLKPGQPELAVVDEDFLHLFRSWFTPGFLQLREVSWSSSGTLLQEVAAHESVHPIQGWSDLRSRLEPADRTCFALVHPAMGERPLVFVEVALADRLHTDMDFLEDASAARAAAPHPTAATFYSINTTYAGLRGIPLGHDLLKQAVAHLRSTTAITTFGTLSPVPGFRAWAEERAARDPTAAAVVAEAAQASADGSVDPGADGLADRLARLARSYLAETDGGRPRDRVARFHLGNGARLAAVHWPAGRSPHLIEQSFGLMVTYLYASPTTHQESP